MVIDRIHAAEVFCAGRRYLLSLPGGILTLSGESKFEGTVKQKPVLSAEYWSSILES